MILLNHEKYFNAFGRKNPHTIEENTFYMFSLHYSISKVHYEISRPKRVNMSLHRYTVIPRIWIIAEMPRRVRTITP